MTDRRPMLVTARQELMTDSEVARLLRRGAKWLSEHRGDLEARGFPKPVPVVGRYDPVAVHAWLDGLAVRARDSGSALLEKAERRWGKSA